MPSITSMPPEMVEAVFKASLPPLPSLTFDDHYTDKCSQVKIRISNLASFARVCRLWYCIVHPLLYRHVSLSSEATKSKFRSALQVSDRRSQVRYLNICVPSDCFPVTLPALRYLVINYARKTQFTPNEWPDMTHLTTLALRNVDFSDVQQALLHAPNLHTLALCCIHPATTACCTRWMTPVLRELKIRLDIPLPDEHFEWLFSPLDGQLTSLDLALTVDEPLLPSMLISFVKSGLQRLRIADGRDDTLLSVLATCTKLKELHLEGGPLMELKHLPETLEVLDIRTFHAGDLEVVELLRDKRWLPGLKSAPRLSLLENDDTATTELLAKAWDARGNSKRA